MMTPWPPAPVAGPPTQAGHQRSCSPASETSTSMRSPKVSPTTPIDTTSVAADTAAVERALAAVHPGNAITRRSSAAAMRLIQRSSRGVFARRALTMSIISRARSARLPMAASHSSAALRKLPLWLEARRLALEIKSISWTTVPPPSLSWSLSSFAFTSCAARYSKARCGLPVESGSEELSINVISSSN